MEYPDFGEYIIELTNLDAEFKNFTQLHKLCDGIILTKYPVDLILGADWTNYSKDNSLLFGASTNKYVEFKNGRPYYFVTYRIIVKVGSPKYTGASLDLFDKIEFTQCNFYSDYFIHHPSKISGCNICDGVLNCEKLLITKGIWCCNCFGDMNSAEKIKLIMHDTMQFSNIPNHSILYIAKDTEIINENNPESLSDIQIFLNRDKKKVDILRSNIQYLENKIKQVTEKLSVIKNYNQNTLDKMLDVRGGSIETYLAMLKEYDDKLGN